MKGLATLLVALALSTLTLASVGGTHTGEVNHAGHPDAITHMAHDHLTGWHGWLAKYKQKGYLGETSVPNEHGLDDTVGLEKWAALFDKSYKWSNDANLWVTPWSANRSGGANRYRLYGPDHTDVSYGGRTIARALYHAPVVEANLNHTESWHHFRRGVNVNGGELHGGKKFCAPNNLRVFGKHYYYPDAEDFRDLAQRLGAANAAPKRIIRLPFRWERVQPTLGGALNATELQRLKGSVADANAYNFQIILDVHNYGGYFKCNPVGSRSYHKIGSGISDAQFADLWRRLSLEFKGNTQIVGYDLMNEPMQFWLSSAEEEVATWERASQTAVDAIRSTGDNTRIMVAGYHKASQHKGQKSGIHKFVEYHPEPWITDPAGRTFYTTHAYWAVRADWTYGQNNAWWESKGY